MTGSRQTWKLALGYIGGALLMVLGVVHSIVGWPAVKAVLAKTDTPADVVTGLATPWHFTAVGMIVLGLLALLALRHVRTEPALASRVLAVSGGACVLFGIAGLLLIKPDPTFAVFIVPGALVLVAAR